MMHTLAAVRFSVGFKREFSLNFPHFVKPPLWMLLLYRKISHSIEKMSTTWNPCKPCSKKVKQPFMFCFDCNEKRRELFTSTCATCSKKIKPDYPKRYSCFEKDKSESVVREPTTKPRIDLREALNAPVYEPQTQSV